jgi:hypothetical protein
MLIHSAVVMLDLSYVGLKGGLIGILLCPAIVLHVINGKAKSATA